MEPTVNFYPLLVVTLLAVAVPIFLHRLPGATIPTIVGEIVAGMIVGHSGLNLITGENAWLEFLKIFGFTYLMFISGLEIDFSVLGRTQTKAATGLKRLVGNPLQAAFLSFAVTLLVATLFSLWLVRLDLARDYVVMALVLSTTSLGVVVPVLKERLLSRTELGQYILVASVVGDFATVFLISGYVILHTSGLTFEILLILVLLAVTFLAYRLAELTKHHLPMENLVQELSHATAQLDTRGALALAVVFIALSQGLGIEIILGAFMAGAMVSLLSREEGSELRLKLNALGFGFFIPIFFIMVGVDFNLPALLSRPEGLLLVPALLAMAFIVKYVAALVYRPILSWRETFALGTLTSARLSLIIAVAAIGVEIGAITEATNSAIILVAIATVITCPIVFNRIVPSVEVKRRRVVIIGAPPQARLLAQRLVEHGEDVSIVTRNEDFVRESQGLALNVVLAMDGNLVNALERARVSEAWAAISMLDSEQEALQVTRTIKDQFETDIVVAMVQNPQLTRMFKESGIQVMDPGLSAITMLQAMINHPQAFSLLTEMEIGRHIVDVKMGNRTLEGRSLRDIPLPGDALVMAVAREGEVIIPRGGTRLRRGDLLTLVGSQEAVEDAAAHLGA